MSTRPPASIEVRRTIITLAVIIVVTVAGIGLWWMATTSVPGLSSRSQIAAIQVSTWPEGPSVLLRAGTPNFDRAVAVVPVPLPRRRVDLSRCHGGATVTIRLVNRASVTYGPCKRPLSIERLSCVAGGAPPDCYKSRP